MAADRKTLRQILEEAQSAGASASTDLSSLVLDLAVACRKIGARLASRRCQAADTAESLGESPAESLAGSLAGAGAGEEVRDELVLLADDEPSCGDQPSGWVSALLARLEAGQTATCYGLRRGQHLVLLRAFDSPSNAEVNAAGGTIFSVLRGETAGPALTVGDFLQRGSRQVCAGYAIHGPSIELVLALAPNVQRFSLDRDSDEFVLTHADLRIPEATREIAIDSSNARFWGPAIRRYVNECLAGESGPRGGDFQFHWFRSIAAEAHLILTSGGVFVCAHENGGIGQEPWLLYEANPIAFIIECAGGRASTGSKRVLDIDVGSSRARTSLVFGAVTEVKRIEEYRGDESPAAYDAPLFAERGLFRITV